MEQRCARWLLMWGDQAEDDAFELTHECFAEMLGVRRSTVTVVACTLQHAVLIHYRRGAITVLDRQGLEATACEVLSNCPSTLRATAGAFLQRMDNSDAKGKSV